MTHSSQRATQLSREQMNYLLLQKSLSTEARRLLDAGQGLAGLSKEGRKELMELVVDRLQAVGFDQRYAPTPEGRLLESIIDVLKDSK